MSEKYKIEYLPIAREDIHQSIYYIRKVLLEPETALKMLQEIKREIYLLQEFPYMGKKFPLKSSKISEIRVIYVKNYAIFYGVKEKTVEIKRVVYAKMNFKVTSKN